MPSRNKKKQQNLNLCVLIIERCWRNKLLIHERMNEWMNEEAYCNRNVFKQSNNQVLMSNNPKLGDNNEEKTRIMRKDEQHNNFHNNSTTIWKPRNNWIEFKKGHNNNLKYFTRNTMQSTANYRNVVWLELIMISVRT